MSPRGLEFPLLQMTMNLKQHPLDAHSSVGQKHKHSMAGFSVQGLNSDIKLLAGLTSHLEPPGRRSTFIGLVGEFSSLWL